MRVSRSDSSVRALQGFVPELFRGVAAVVARDDETLDAGPGTRWYAAESGGGVTLGDEVELRHGDVAVWR